MPGEVIWDSDLILKGKAKVDTVPNTTGTVVTYNPTSKIIGTRTNNEIISDLGLITATNIASQYYTKTNLQTPGESAVHWDNVTNIPTLHRVNTTGSLINPANSVSYLEYSNKSYFDYNWDGANFGLGSVINFSGLNGAYSTEIFGAYNGTQIFGMRTRNGDSGTWNPAVKLWHSGNFNSANYLPLTGGTITGPLEVNGGLTVGGVSDLNGGIRSNGLAGSYWQVSNGATALFVIGSEAQIMGGATTPNVGYYSYGGIHKFYQEVEVPNATVGNHAVNLSQLNSALTGYATESWVGLNYEPKITTLPVNKGGSGAGTFTAGYLKANGTSPFSTVNQIPYSDISGTPAIPAQVSISQGTGITVGGTYPNITITNSSPNATHTGDVTGSTALTIGDNKVTFAKMQNIATQRLLGRGATGTGAVTEISLGANLSLDASGVLSATDTNTTYTLASLGGQPLDADLTAIAGLTGTVGLLKKTALDTWVLDTKTYVDTTTAQNIAGDKSFTNNLSISPRLAIKDSVYGLEKFIINANVSRIVARKSGASTDEVTLFDWSGTDPRFQLPQNGSKMSIGHYHDYYNSEGEYNLIIGAGGIRATGSVKATGNFKSDAGSKNTLFIPDGTTSTIEHEILNEGLFNTSIRLRPLLLKPSNKEIIDDNHRLIRLYCSESGYIELVPYMYQNYRIYNISDDDVEIRKIVGGLYVSMITLAKGWCTEIDVDDTLTMYVEKEKEFTSY